MRKILSLLLVLTVFTVSSLQQSKWVEPLGIQQSLYLPGDLITKDLTSALRLGGLSTITPQNCPDLTYIPPHDPKTDITLPYDTEGSLNNCRLVTQTRNKDLYIALCNTDELVLLAPKVPGAEVAKATSVKVSSVSPGSTQCYAVDAVKNKNLVFVSCGSGSSLFISAFEIMSNGKGAYNLKYQSSVQMAALPSNTEASSYKLYSYELLNLGPDNLFSYQVYIEYSNFLGDTGKPPLVLYSVGYASYKFNGDLTSVDVTKIPNFPKPSNILSIQGDAEFMYVFNGATENLQVQICYMSSVTRAFCGMPVDITEIIGDDNYFPKVSKVYRSSEITITTTSSQDIFRYIYTLDTSTNDLSLKLVGDPFAFFFQKELPFIKDIRKSHSIGNNVVIEALDADKKVRIVRVFIKSSNYIEIPVSQTGGDFIVTLDPTLEKDIDISLFGSTTFTLIRSGPPSIQIAAKAATDGANCILVAVYKDNTSFNTSISYSVLKDMYSGAAISASSKVVGYQGEDFRVPVSSTKFTGNMAKFSLKNVNSANSTLLNASVLYSDSYRVNKDYPEKILKKNIRNLGDVNPDNTKTTMLNVGENFYLDVRDEIIKVYYIEDILEKNKEFVSLLEVYSFPITYITDEIEEVKIKSATFSNGFLWMVFDIRIGDDYSPDENHDANTAIASINLQNLLNPFLKVGYSNTASDFADILIQDGDVLIYFVSFSLYSQKISYLRINADSKLSSAELEIQPVANTLSEQRLCPTSIEFGPVGSKSVFLMSQCTDMSNVFGTPVEAIFHLSFGESPSHLSVLDVYPIKGMSGKEFCVTNNHIHIARDTPQNGFQIVAINLNSEDSSQYVYPFLELQKEILFLNLICDTNADMFHVFYSATDESGSTNKYIASYRGNASAGGNRRVHSVNKIEDTRDAITAGYSSGSDTTVILAVNSEVEDSATAIILRIEAPLIYVRSSKNLKDSQAVISGDLQMTLGNGSQTLTAPFSARVFKYTDDPTISIKSGVSVASLVPKIKDKKNGVLNLENIFNVTGSVRKVELTSESSYLSQNKIQQRLQIQKTQTVQGLGAIQGVRTLDNDLVFYYGEGYVAVKKGDQQEVVLPIDGRRVVNAQIMSLTDLELPVLVFSSQYDNKNTYVDVVFCRSGSDIKSYQIVGIKNNIINTEGEVFFSPVETKEKDVFQMQTYTNIGGTRLITYLFQLDPAGKSLTQIWKPTIQIFEEKIHSLALVNLLGEIQITVLTLGDEQEFYFQAEAVSVVLDKNQDYQLSSTVISTQRHTLVEGDASTSPIPVLDHLTSKLGCRVISQELNAPIIGCALIGGQVFSVYYEIQLADFTSYQPNTTNKVLANKILNRAFAMKNLPGFQPLTVHLVGDHVLSYQRNKQITESFEDVNNYPNPLTQNELLTVYKIAGDSEYQLPFGFVTGSELRKQNDLIPEDSIGAFLSSNKNGTYLVTGKQRSDQIEFYLIQDFMFLYNDYTTIDIKSDSLTTYSYTSSGVPQSSYILNNFFADDFTPARNDEESKKLNEDKRLSAELVRKDANGARESAEMVREANFMKMDTTFNKFIEKANSLNIDVSENQIYTRVKNKESKKINDLANKVTGLYTKIEKISMRTTENYVKPLTTRVNALVSKNADTKKVVGVVQTSLAGAIKDTSSRIASLNSKTTSQTAQIKSIKSKTQNLDSQVDKVNVDVDEQVKTQVSESLKPYTEKSVENTALLSTISTKSSSVKNSIDQSGKKIQTCISDNSNAISRIDGNLEANKRDIQGLEKKVSEIKTQLKINIETSVSSKVKPLNGRISELDTKQNEDQTLYSEKAENMRSEIQLQSFKFFGIKFTMDTIDSKTKEGGEIAQKKAAAFKEHVTNEFGSIKTKLLSSKDQSEKFDTQIIILFVIIAVLLVVSLVLIGVISYLFVTINSLKGSKVGPSGLGDGVGTESDYSRLQQGR